MAKIPRFMVCVDDAESSAETLANFVVVDVPVKDGQIRRGALMFSTSDRAGEFITNNPGEWHTRILDAELLAAFLDDPRNRSQFDCVVIDFPNNGKEWITFCFDADKAAESLKAWSGDQGEMPNVETWHVFM